MCTLQETADWLQPSITEISATAASSRASVLHHTLQSLHLGHTPGGMAIIRTVERRSKHVSIIYIVCMLLICSGSWRHWVQKCGFLYSCLYILSSQQCRAAPTPAPVLGGSRDVFITTIGETKNVTRLVPTTFYIHIAGPGWVQGTNYRFKRTFAKISQLRRTPLP